MEKSKSKKINKSKLVILVSSIALLLFVIIGVVILANKINNRKNNNEEENSTNEISMESKAKDLLYNNYLISYMLEDDVKIGEGVLTIEGEDKVYYAVDDPLLNNIKSMQDITNLIEGNLSSEAIVRTGKLMETDYANQYLVSNGTLYVRKTATPCSVYENGPIDRSKITYRNEDNKVYAIYENVPFRGYYDDYNELKAPTLWFACSDNFVNTGTDKDSVYDPNYTDSVQDDSTVDENENGEN